jgi:hypothetical protein
MCFPTPAMLSMPHSKRAGISKICPNKLNKFFKFIKIFEDFEHIKNKWVFYLY